MSSILLVDDESDVLMGLLGEMLPSETLVGAASGEEALAVLAQRADIALVLLDIVMPASMGTVDEREGLMVLREMQRRRPELPVVVLSALGDVDVVVEAMRLGAQNYIQKPPEPAKLRQIVRHTALKDVACSSPALSGPMFGPMVGACEGMRKVYGLIQRAAQSNCNVLILGETGTGKELVAQEVHRRSKRSSRPLKAVNCSAISGNLLESILFGHRKGAFTGADADRAGMFQAANGGTLFLDEIGDMSSELQPKLLRALEQGSVLPVGATDEERVDVRIISATHQNLPAMVRDGRFREDLFYRLNLLLIPLPPLRERAGDIPMLVEHFVTRCAEKESRAVPSVTSGAMAAIGHYAWPGNVRELEHKIHGAVVQASGDALGAELFDFAFTLTPTGPPAGEALWVELTDVSRHPHDLTVLRNRHGSEALKAALQRALEEFGDVRSAGQGIGVISDAKDHKEYARFRKWLSNLGVSNRRRA
jgi:two-component system, NtrC family, response regulator HydG